MQVGNLRVGALRRQNTFFWVHCGDARGKECVAIDREVWSASITSNTVVKRSRGVSFRVFWAGCDYQFVGWQCGRRGHLGAPRFDCMSRLESLCRYHRPLLSYSRRVLGREEVRFILRGGSVAVGYPRSPSFEQRIRSWGICRSFWVTFGVKQFVCHWNLVTSGVTWFITDGNSRKFIVDRLSSSFRRKCCHGYSWASYRWSYLARWDWSCTHNGWLRPEVSCIQYSGVCCVRINFDWNYDQLRQKWMKTCTRWLLCARTVIERWKKAFSKVMFWWHVSMRRLHSLWVLFVRWWWLVSALSNIVDI